MLTDLLEVLFSDADAFSDIEAYLEVETLSDVEALSDGSSHIKALSDVFSDVEDFSTLCF